MITTNILLYGEGGSGKSSSIATLFKYLPKYPDLKVRYLCTEANALRGMISGIKHHKIKLEPNQLHYMIARPTYSTKYTSKHVADDFKKNFLDLEDSGALKVKIAAGDRARHTEFMNILLGMASFKGIDYVTEEESDLGDYLTWDENIIFVVDSLTSCADYLFATVKGNRIATIQSDYNDTQSNLLSKIIIPGAEARCSFIMLGHPHIGKDQNVIQPTQKEVNAGQADFIQKLYPYTCGQALNNKVIGRFTETIYSYVDDFGSFYWAGRKKGIATSTRAIPQKDKLVPDFSLYNIFED